MYLTLLPTWRKCAEAYAKCDEAYAKCDEARAKRNEADAKWLEAHTKWNEAVRTVCGPDARIEWTDEGCLVLGVMLFLYNVCEERAA